MKKILLARELKPTIQREEDIFKRADFQILIPDSGEDIVKKHRTGQVDLIILQLDMGETTAEKTCSLLRNDDTLKHVSILVICNKTKTDLERVQRCQANAYVTRPIRHELLTQKVSQLLAIPERQEYRVLLKITGTGKLNATPFFCTSFNISVSGMLIETEKVLEKGDIISCSFFLPNSDQILTEAEIMRTIKTPEKAFHYGIRYLNLLPRYRTEIEKFIRQRSQRSL